MTARILLLFGLLAILVTWPLALHLGTQVIGPFRGDNLEYVWKIWWVKHALLDLNQSPLVQPDIYYPFGYPLAYGEITPSHTYLGLPLTALLGPVATYNLFILVSFALTGLFTVLLVRRLTGSTPAGLVAGLILAYCPYRMARIAGNLPLIDTQWLPLVLLFLERYADRRRWPDAVGAGLGVAASALSSWYYAAALGLLLPVYVVARFRLLGGQRWRFWLTGGLACVLAAVLPLIPFLIPYLSVQQAGEASTPLEQAAFWSASLTDYLTPNPRHFVWGNWVTERLVFYPGGLPYEFILGWGLVSTVLALYGWRRGRETTVRGWLPWTAVAVLLSLGPVFTLFDKLVTLPAPAAAAQTINETLTWLGRRSLAGEPYLSAPPGRFVVPLPALLLRWFVPGFVGMRSWGRLSILATLGVAVLAGIGVDAFLRGELEHKPTRRSGLRKWSAAVLLAGLIFFEFYTGPQALITPGPRPVDLWLASQPRRTTLVQMPLVSALSGPQMYYTMHHGQRIISGYGTYLPILFEANYPELLDFPSDESIDVLASWPGGGVETILIDESDVPAGDSLWQAVAVQSRLQLEAIVGSVAVYRLK